MMSLAKKILALAEHGPVTASEISEVTYARREYVTTELSRLKSDGLMAKVGSHPARYALVAMPPVPSERPTPDADEERVRVPRRGMATVNRNHARVAEGRRKTFAEQLAAAEQFLADCPRLPLARVPEWRERGGPRRRTTGQHTYVRAYVGGDQ